MAETEAYSHLNRNWKASCKVLLGEEIGELSEYSDWLYQGNGPRISRKSEISGKEVIFSTGNYPKNARFVSLDEVKMDAAGKDGEKIDASNLDSILEFASKNSVYAGNMVLGNSAYVEQSTNITDCFYVKHSERVAYSKYVAHSTRGGYSENVFGCYGFGLSSFLVKCRAVTDSTRCFAVSKADHSSDIYYSHGLSGCTECIFCFNLRNRKYCIGNRELPKEKYFEAKKRILKEIRERLLREKRLPGISDIFAGVAPNCLLLKQAMAAAPEWKLEKLDKALIEKAFSEATKIVLGKGLAPIDAYSKWLSRDSSIILKNEKSCASGKPLLVSDYAGFLSYPKDRLVTQEEADYLGEKLRAGEDEALQISLANAGKTLSGIAYFCPIWSSGNLKNNIDSPLNLDSQDCYRGALYILSKLCGFCFSPRSCEYSFGCREGRHNSFCINCHFSTKIARCFEVDSANNCTGLYFCHNVENVHDSMFCFNVKNKRYAIGNVEVGRERFLEAKKALLQALVGMLEGERDLPISAYNLGGQ